MRALLQRVTEASVTVASETIGQIGAGWLVLLGVGSHDTEADVQWLANKIIELRLFNDDEGRFNRSLIDIGGSILVVSQFTLFADCSRGRRPSFTSAAPPRQANELYEFFVRHLREQGMPVQTGRFAASMQVHLVNDGPVTIWLDSVNRSL